MTMITDTETPTVSEIVLAAAAEVKADPSQHPGHTRGESFGVIGAAFVNLAAADKNTTISVLGDDGGTLHKVVATEIVSSNQLSNPPPVLQNSILLIHPKIPDVNFLITAANRRNLMITAVIPKVNDGTKNLNLHPTAARLLEAGVHQVVRKISVSLYQKFMSNIFVLALSHF
jgi:hypothetical protein